MNIRRARTRILAHQRSYRSSFFCVWYLFVLRSIVQLVSMFERFLTNHPFFSSVYLLSSPALFIWPTRRLTITTITINHRYDDDCICAYLIPISSQSPPSSVFIIKTLVARRSAFCVHFGLHSRLSSSTQTSALFALLVKTFLLALYLVVLLKTFVCVCQTRDHFFACNRPVFAAENNILRSRDETTPPPAFLFGRTSSAASSIWSRRTVRRHSNSSKGSYFCSDSKIQHPSLMFFCQITLLCLPHFLIFFSSSFHPTGNCSLVVLAGTRPKVNIPAIHTAIYCPLFFHQNQIIK